jgi:hypothetical protein
MTQPTVRFSGKFLTEQNAPITKLGTVVKEQRKAIKQSLKRTYSYPLSDREKSFQTESRHIIKVLKD